MSLSIGKPISNTKVYILDRHLNPLPVGISGELYVGGIALARGYLGRPALTREKFISNPFGGGRLYKTGDLARYLADGRIELLGRIDHQIKIRGYRIELGEIEAALIQNPQVKEVVVIAQENQDDETYLVAYMVPNQYQVPSPKELRQFLKQKLPHYMIPAAFVPLDAFPLTPNGKIDRRALPKPDWSQQAAAAFIAPRNPIEQGLADIWAEVLHLDQVGIHDNFFDLGGHSLLATQVMSRIIPAFSVRLTVRTLFDCPTVAELAHYVTSVSSRTHGISIPTSSFPNDYDEGDL